MTARFTKKTGPMQRSLNRRLRSVGHLHPSTNYELLPRATRQGDGDGFLHRLVRSMLELGPILDKIAQANTAATYLIGKVNVDQNRRWPPSRAVPRRPPTCGIYRDGNRSGPLRELCLLKARCGGAWKSTSRSCRSRLPRPARSNPQRHSQAPSRCPKTGCRQACNDAEPPCFSGPGDGWTRTPAVFHPTLYKRENPCQTPCQFSRHGAPRTSLFPSCPKTPRSTKSSSSAPAPSSSARAASSTTPACRLARR